MYNIIKKKTVFQEVRYSFFFACIITTLIKMYQMHWWCFLSKYDNIKYNNIVKVYTFLIC